MTATERQYRGRSDQIVSMDDYDVYGDTFELLPFKQALEAKPPILSDYKIITIAVTEDEIQHLIEKNLFVKPDRGVWNEEVEAEMLTSAIALRKAIQKYPINHAISFHRSIAKAKAFQNTHDILNEALSEYKNLETFHVTGKTPSSERSKEIDRFASAETSLITNARCLTEGVDIPNIDCVLFADPKKSTIDIVQAVGRALRTAPNKECGYVIIPVLINQDEADISTIENNTFESILVILRALASNDDRIIEYFRSISQGKAKTESGVHIEVDVPLGLKIDIEEFINAIDIRIWSKLAKLSWRSFREARVFAHTLKLKSQGEWRKYCQGGFPMLPPKPDDIPATPARVYKSNGWKGEGDWLGTEIIATQLREYLPFNEARDFVHKLNLKNETEWRKYRKGGFPDLPPDMVNTVNNKQQSLAIFFIGSPIKKMVIYTYPPVHGQRRGHHVTTVDQSDMRGLGTE